MAKLTKKQNKEIKRSKKKADSHAGSDQPEIDEDLYTCENCGAQVDPNRNICMKCGAFHDPIQRMMAEKVMQQTNAYSTRLAEAPSFKGMGMKKEIQYNDGLRYLEKMRLNEAVQYYEKAVKKNPSNVTNWNNYGVAYMGLKDRRSAFYCYGKAIKLDLLYYIGLYNIGAVYFECNQYEKAIKYFDQALKINPNCGEAYWDKIIANERLGKFELGSTFEAMKKGLNVMRARMNRSSALVDLGNGYDAILGYYRFYFKHKGKLTSLINDAVEYAKKGDRNQAIEVLNKCIKINPQHPKVWILKGQLLFQAKNMEESLICLENATKIDANLFDAWLMRGSLLALKKQNKQALTCLDQALRINPFNNEAKEAKLAILRESYFTLRKQGKYHEALKAIDEVLASDTTRRGDWWVDKGTIYAELNNVDKALESFNQALMVDPKNLLAWVNKGAMYLKAGKYLAAYECYSEALKIKPGDERSLEGRTVALAKSREGRGYDKEIEKVKESLNRHSKVAVEWFNKGITKTQAGAFEEAFKYLDKALEIDEDFHEVWFQKANIYIAQEDYANAISCFNEVLRLNPELPMLMIDLWINKGVCHRKIGELNEALKCYEKASQIDPKIGDIWANMGNIYLDMKKPLEALQYFDKAIEVGSDQSAFSPTAKNSKGTAFLELGRFQEALDMFSTVLDFNPAFAPSWVGKGVALHNLKRFEESLSCLDKAIAIEPNYTIAWYEKAKLLYEIKDFQRAFLSYNKISQIDPTYLTPDDHSRIHSLRKLLLKNSSINHKRVDNDT